MRSTTFFTQATTVVASHAVGSALAATSGDDLPVVPKVEATVSSTPTAELNVRHVQAGSLETRQDRSILPLGYPQRCAA